MLDPAGELPASMLRQVYETWCRDSGVRFPLSPGKLAARLEARGCRQRRGPKGTRFWEGLRIPTPSDAGDAGDARFRNSIHVIPPEGSSGE